jgi:hypothetical protein
MNLRGILDNIHWVGSLVIILLTLCVIGIIIAALFSALLDGIFGWSALFGR